MRHAWSGGIGLIALSCGLLLSGCSEPLIAETHFAQFVPFGQGGVSTDAVLPPTGGTVPLLGGSWAAWSEQGAVDGLWIHGRHAEFDFFAAVMGDLRLELHGQPFTPARAPSQEMTIVLNGEVIDTLPLVPGTETYEIPLPRGLVREGWNHARMEFSQAVRPSDFINGNRDTRPRAARFRRILLHSPLNRPLWLDRPAEIGLSNASSSFAGAVIEMPTDSFLDIIVRPAAGQQLVGSAAVSLVGSGRPADVRTAIELLDATGVAREIFSAAFAADSSSEAALQADLSEWTGELVQIRVRTWGDSNAIVHWTGLGLSASAATEHEARAHERGVARESAERGRLLRHAGNGEAERPDVILILLYAARADALSGVGGPPSTPSIDALASGATHFTAAWSPSSWTGQTVPAVFTGLHPDAVGAEVWGSRLAEGIPTLAELLASDGYFAVLWTQHTIYRGNPSLRKGFEAYEAVVGARSIENRLQLPDADFLFVEDRPTFAIIHLLPPHDPYEPPEPFLGRLTEWYSGDLDFESTDLNVLQFDMPTDEAERSEIIRYAHHRYLENIELADHLVGRLVRLLKDAGRYEGALIIVTSDHGEAFFEHERFLHTVQLYEESIRVPLFVKWPFYMNGFAREVTQPVTLLDLAPTLTEGLRVSGEAAPFHGRSLIPMAYDNITHDRGLYAYTRGNRRSEQAAAPVYAYRSGRHKIIYSPLQHTLQLFDLQQDPLEEHDLAAADPLRARYLLQQAMLQKKENLALLARSGPQEIQSLDAETLRQLRALGYVR